MQINEGIGAAKKEGYKLLKTVPESGFELPATEVDLIKLSGSLRIYLKYEAHEKGKLDFHIDSFADWLNASPIGRHDREERPRTCAK